MCINLSLPATAQADMGPKPSVRVQFVNLGDELCFGTLISKTPSTGPYSVWDKDLANANPHNLDLSVWQAFADYEDADGYYFLQTAWEVSSTKEIAWTYYPPNDFKVLLYYQNSGKFIASNVCQKYAFSSYFTVDVSGANINSVTYDENLSNDDEIQTYQSHNFWREFIGFAFRVAFTVLIEVGCALLFAIKDKKQLLFIVAVNVVTQIILNLLLNFANYGFDALLTAVLYGLFEFAVFAIEAVAYCAFLNKFTTNARKPWFYVCYALIANVVSFVIGLQLVHFFAFFF